MTAAIAGFIHGKYALIEQSSSNIVENAKIFKFLSENTPKYNLKSYYVDFLSQMWHPTNNLEKHGLQITFVHICGNPD